MYQFYTKKSTLGEIGEILNILLIMVIFGFNFALANKLHTPKRGTVERKVILNGLRYWVKNNHNILVRFVVKKLRVHNGWAYIVANPESKNKKEHYEAIAALLKKGKACWVVVAVLSNECASSEDPNACDKEESSFINSVTGKPLYTPRDIFR